MTTQHHLSAEKLQELLDGRLPREIADQARLHLEACPDCAREFRSLSALDRNLRRIPLEQTGPAFTATLMNRLRLVPSTKESGRIFELFAYSVGLLLVLAVMTTAFYVTGLIPSGGSGQDPAIQALLAKGTSVLRDGTGVLTGIFSPVSQQLPRLGGFHIALFAISVIVVLAVVDRIVGRKVLPRS
jgi:anti-sigma factor RsiW